MNDIVLTSFLTASFGIIGALMGYIIINFYIEPIKELKMEIGMVSYKLILWAGELSNPGISKDMSEASSDLRKSSSMIRAKYAVIPKRAFCDCFYGIPDANNIDIAGKALMHLSNSVSTRIPDNIEKSNDHIEQSIAKLKKALIIETDFE